MSTSIEWTDESWNPIRGCSLVSEGCRSCYAMKQAHRFSGVGGAYEGLTRLGPHGPTWTGAIRLVPEKLTEPLSWKKPRRVFVNSMSDLFQDGVPDSYVDQVFAVMALTPQHTYQVLTKRAARMKQYLASRRTENAVFNNFDGMKPLRERRPDPRWPLPNVWIGVSVENQHFADERIPLLLQTPAAVRFISAEPLLESVDLTRLPIKNFVPPGHTMHGVDGIVCSALTSYPGRSFATLDWVIVGGESGPGARPFEISWARSIVSQCKDAGVHVFMKQLGAHVLDYNDAGFEGDQPRAWPMDTTTDEWHEPMFQHDLIRIRLKKKGGVMEEWPRDLRIREFPTVHA